MVTLVFESFNEEKGKYNYNNWPQDNIINGHEQMPLNNPTGHYIPFPLNNPSGKFVELPEYVQKKTTYKLLKDLDKDERYLYPIILDHWLYFEKMAKNNFSFNFIDKKVIDDVRNNRAKIIIIHLVETNHFDDFLILHRWCKLFNFTKDQVYFINGNFLGPHYCKKFNFNFTAYISNDMIRWNIPKLNFELEYAPDSDKNLFLTLNRMERAHRTLLICRLLENNIFHRGLISYKGGVNTPEKLNNLIRSLTNDNLLDEVHQLLHKIPLTLDIQNLENINPVTIKDVSLYEKTFLSIITETKCQDDTVFFTEKTWKTIGIGHPFMIVSSRHSLKVLKELGFKTFDKWIDESYDDLDHVNLRINKIVSELNRLSKLSVDELKTIRSEMSETIRYNKFVHAKYYTKTDSIADDFGFYPQLNKIWSSFNT